MKKIKIIFVVICVLSIIIPLIFTDYEGGKVSKQDNRVLANGPIAFLKNGSSANITKWINDNIGFRTAMLGYKGYIEYNILHKSPTNRVMLGKNGFMFYTWDNNIEIAQNKYPLSEKEIRRITKNLILINDILEKNNKTFLFTIAPSKVDIYPEYLNIGRYSKTTTPIDVFSERLDGKVNFINLKEALYKEKENTDELLYYKTDTHWNQYGAYIAYKAILNKMNEVGIFGDNRQNYMQVDFVEATRVGEFANMMGAKYILKPEHTLNTNIINSRISYIKDLPKYLIDNKAKYSPFAVYGWKSSGSKEILVIGDSMISGWHIPELIANHYNTYYHIWQHQFDNETIFKSNSDIVLLEVAERYTKNLINVTNNFIKENYKPSAHISSNDIPKIMEKGKPYSFHVTIKNTGKYNLGYDYMTEAGMLFDSSVYKNIDQGVRFYLPENVVIKPGEEYILKITDYIPKHDGKYMIFKVAEASVNWISNGIKIDLKQP